jgi:hypothetical protein
MAIFNRSRYCVAGFLLVPTCCFFFKSQPFFFYIYILEVVDRFSRRTHFACIFLLVNDSEMGLLDTETNDVDGVSCWSGDSSISDV